MKKQYEFKGEFYEFKELMQFSVVSVRCLQQRIYLGWDIEKAVLTPSQRTVKGEKGKSKQGLGGVKTKSSIDQDINKKHREDEKKERANWCLGRVLGGYNTCKK